eukprot:scaffold3030_cov72-Cyclotella_meneghiniana.AAC.6
MYELNMDLNQASTTNTAEPYNSNSSTGEAGMPCEHSSSESISKNPLQIHISSTLDADMILRKIIEDRSAMLTLKHEADRNEKELIKAKVWQAQTNDRLSRLDSDISRLVAKAKCDITNYNELARQYVKGFVTAFQNGEIDTLHRHPFLPNLKELEGAIACRKALVIEKTQADDRVRKIKVLNSRHSITKTMLKKNEEAFVRAVDITKHQFSNSCALWLSQFEHILSDLPGETICNLKVSEFMLEHLSTLTVTEHRCCLEKDKATVVGATTTNHDMKCKSLQVKLPNESLKRPSMQCQECRTNNKRLKTDSHSVVDPQRDDDTSQPMARP